MTETKKTHSASCECGGVSFVVSGDLRPVMNCHCSQCLKTHGHYAAYTQCMSQQLEFLSDTTLQWYRSSDIAERGFCNHCGASIFWKPLSVDSEVSAGDEGISIAAGMFDQPSSLVTRDHIFVASKGDYYSITDGLQQHAASTNSGDT